MKKMLLLSFPLVLASLTAAHATPIAGVIDNSVSGFDMAGILVSVEYADGNIKTKKWKADSGDRGYAKRGDKWSLSFDGSNTWYSNNLDDVYYPGDPDRLATWEFEAAKPVSSLTIDAISGGFVFDILAIWDDVWGPTDFPNTDGSGDGWWQENSFTSDATSGYSTTNYFSWEFFDPITINGQPALDLYGGLTINFDNPNTGRIEHMTGAFSFGVDTDKVTPVPEPATMMLVGTGLLGIIGASRRRKK